MMTFQQRIDALEPADQEAVIRFIEFVEWKRTERPLIVQQRWLDRSAEQAQRLRAVREALGKSEEDAARVADVALHTYLAYERRGPRRWSSAKIFAYCETWGVNTGWLLLGEGEMFVRPPISRQRTEASGAIVIDWQAAKARKAAKGRKGGAA